MFQFLNALHHMHLHATSLLVCQFISSLSVSDFLSGSRSLSNSSLLLRTPVIFSGHEFRVVSRYVGRGIEQNRGKKEEETKWEKREQMNESMYGKTNMKMNHLGYEKHVGSVKMQREVQSVWNGRGNGVNEMSGTADNSSFGKMAEQSLVDESNDESLYQRAYFGLVKLYLAKAAAALHLFELAKFEFEDAARLYADCYEIRLAFEDGYLGLNRNLISLQEFVLLEVAELNRAMSCWTPPIQDLSQNVIDQLEGSAYFSCDIRTMLLVADFMEKNDRKQHAADLYLKIVTKYPFAVEAAVAYCRIAQDMKDPDCTSLIDAYAKFSLENLLNVKLVALEEEWIGKWVLIHVSICKRSYRPALESLALLQKMYPNNPVILSLKGQLLAILGDLDLSKCVFRALYQTRQFYFEGLDFYAWVLHSRGALSELRDLWNLFKVHRSNVPEVLIVEAFYYSLQDNESAIQTIDLALEKFPRRSFCHIARGVIFGRKAAINSNINGSKHIEVGYFEKSLAAYRAAHAMSKSLIAFQGIIDCLLACLRYNDALLVAREALELQPRNPVALAMIGNVLSNSVGGREKSRIALNKALSIDPTSSLAILGLVRLEQVENNFVAAIRLLEKFLGTQHNRDFLLVKLAMVFFLLYFNFIQLYDSAGDAMQALKNLQIALSISPEMSHAKVLLEQYEQKTLKITSQ